MADAPRAPQLPPLEGWVQVDDSTDTPFELGPVSVVARTIVVEDASIRETFPTLADGPWRFVFASRLAVSPRTPPSKALTGLVARGAKSGFESQLAERGFSNIRQTGTRPLRIGSVDAEVTQYEASVSLAGVRLAASAMFAVRPAGEQFLLTGGAYPRAVLADDDVRSEIVDTTALRDAIDPETFRRELLRAIRETT
ncbi:hypothetical protein ACFQJC_09335 [Haloferax namakaokahaiae]|uniref:Uncharacterized protein n=1 Tax=Haloferax namakaokahaiae TaxID=1748331 RepID=A0ABD5ZES3_9EURY